jgi:hypothetical protein
MQWLRVDLKVALDLGEATRPKLTLFKFQIQPDQLAESVARLDSVLPAFNNLRGRSSASSRAFAGVSAG